MIKDFFLDWVKLDTIREKISAEKIKQHCMKRIYDPDSGFFFTQANYDWNLIRKKIMNP
jgi:hypothetical protein